MSTYIIKSSTLNRLASVCSFFASTTPEDLKQKINTVRLENRNGHSFAIASNQKIGSIEYLGRTEAPDGSAHLILSELLLKQLELEAMIDSSINLTTIPEIALSTLQSETGYFLTDCCYWWDDTPLKDWRGWGVKASDESRGAMFWNLFHIETLIKASPSGEIYFPDFIDVNYPVAVRDYHNPAWVGVFFPVLQGGQPVKEPANLPDWWEI